ncbi:MAG: hypothetical protein JSU92_13340 [Deltaproteobacteria bacterium]|nr:MAG: hypothetical protein JSU92_13340 [Deltaproteobacteria bacterium]
MILGFNHNIKYKGIMFHIQTEDSGVTNPHVITHIFIGGNIVATKKTNYDDIIKADRLEDVVRDIMEEQHKQMMKDLLAGTYDENPLVQSALPKTFTPEEMEREEKRAEQFGDDLLSDKSLDEVILDYLVEESEKK